MAVYAVIVFLGLVRSVMAGNWFLAVVLALLASPVPMALTRAFVEGGSVRDMFDPNLQSWTFIFGDIIALPLAVAMAALGWQELSQAGTQWYTNLIWLLASAAIGALSGLGFHLLDSGAYRAAGAANALESPTKLVHDFVAYPILFGAIVCVGVPLLGCTVNSFRPWLHFDLKPYAGLMLIGLLGWVVLGAMDARVHIPKPADMHPTGYTWP